VCHEWLDIINNHRAIQTSVVYNPSSWPHHTFLRNFKNICIENSSFGAGLIIDANVLSQAREVKFLNCNFPNLGTLKECILACGNLSRLEIVYPLIPDCVLLENDSETLSQRIETLVLHLFDDKQCQILDLLQNGSIEVRNIELFIENITSGDEKLRPLVVSLEKCQGKLRELDVNNESLFDLLKDLPRLTDKIFHLLRRRRRVCRRIYKQPTHNHRPEVL
jgi:hypothetical protein